MNLGGQAVMAEPIKKSALTEEKKLLAEGEPWVTAASSLLMVSPPTKGQGSAPGLPDIFRECLENIGDLKRRLVANIDTSHLAPTPAATAPAPVPVSM